jgi:hypothetical protein
MQFVLGMKISECSFVKYTQGTLKVNLIAVLLNEHVNPNLVIAQLTNVHLEEKDVCTLHARVEDFNIEKDYVEEGGLELDEDHGDKEDIQLDGDDEKLDSRELAHEEYPDLDPEEEELRVG